MEAIAGLVEQARPHREDFPWAQVARAHKLGEGGRTKGGKLVLTID
ncbi:MAG: hypothetical protein M3O89_10345 [Actinomycetota bacterium]|nr:hypothetical protein [Actinomycetota bacterium]